MTYQFRKSLYLGLLAAGLFAANGGARAHHSFAVFDQGSIKTVSGTVKEWQWTNPHSWLEVMVTGADGTQKEYGFETGSIYLLSRQKLTRHSFTPGQAVVVSYHPLRNGENGGSLQSVKAPDGTVLLGGGPPAAGGAGAPPGSPGAPPAGGAPGGPPPAQ